MNRRTVLAMPLALAAAPSLPAARQPRRVSIPDDIIEPVGWTTGPGDIHVFLDGVEIKDCCFAADEATGEVRRYLHDHDGKFYVEWVVDGDRIVRAGDLYDADAGLFGSIRIDQKDYLRLKDGSIVEIVQDAHAASETVHGVVTLLNEAEFQAARAAL